MELRLFQEGFNFSQDGPGNRLVYHLQGCNLHCPWCANPEGLSADGGYVRTVDELVQKTLRSKMMFFDGGGVTLTGGEATLQFEAVKVLLTRLHSDGIHTCIETNGASRRIAELFPVLDYLILDIKHYDPNKHRKITGLSCELTHDTLRAALRDGPTLALRIPLIGGFNASLADARGFAALFQSLSVGGRATVELLPYHEYGKSKYAGLGIPYTMGEEAKISAQTLQIFTEVLKAAGLTLIHT
mgnify:CR=1 FL=1